MNSAVKKILIAFGTFALTLGLAGAEPVNEKCPIKGKSVDASKSADYKVKFCCNKCVKKFEKDPLAYAEKVAGAEDGKCAFSGKAVDDEATSTVSIGVCCGGCLKKVKADPGKYFGKLQKAS